MGVIQRICPRGAPAPSGVTRDARPCAQSARRPRRAAWRPCRGPAPQDESYAPGHTQPVAALAANPLSASARMTPRSKMAPIAAERFALQLSIGQKTYDKLRRAQALMRHQLPGGELAEVVDRALDALIARLERRKFAATTRP